MRRVWILLPSMHPGGSERVILNILKYHDRKSMNIRLILLLKQGQLLSEVPEDIPVQAMGKILLIPGTGWLCFIELIRMARREGPDVILSFLWYANFVALLAKVVGRLDCRLIVSERSSFLGSQEGFLIERFRKLIARHLYGYSDSVLVNSNGLREQLRGLFHVNEEKIRVIYNPLDLEGIEELSRGEVQFDWFREEIPVVVGIGRLQLAKGFTYLLRAIKILVDGDCPCRLVLVGGVGTGKSSEKEEIDRIIREHNLEKFVWLAGHQENPYKFLSKATVFVLSSLYEGFPNVILESFSLGIPVVSTRCPTGPEELIENGVDGFLVETRNPAALANAIRNLILDPGLREKIGKAGKRKADQFNVRKIVRAYESILVSEGNT